MSKRIVVASLFVALVAFAACFFAGCPKPKPKEGDVPPPGMMEKAEAPPEAEAEKPSGEPIKIGAIFSVTGPASPLGEPEKLAANMIEKQVNENGGVLGRPLDVIIRDDKSEPTETSLAAKDLINTENVCAIIGPSRTPCTLAITDMCQKAGVPLVAAAAGRPITVPVKSHVFAVPQTDTLAVAKIIEYLKEEGIESVASIYAANAYGKSGHKEIKRLTKEADIELVGSESFGGEATDMTPQLKKLQQKDPGAIICWGTNPGPAIVTKNMEKLGMEMPLLQSHGVANQKFIDLAGDAANGVMLPAGRLLVWQEVPEEHPQKQVLVDFAKAFEKEYDRSVDTFAGHAYDALHVVIDAIKRAETADRAKLRDAIEKTGEFVGTAGVFNFSEDDHRGLTKEAFVWVEIRDGKYHIAE